MRDTRKRYYGALDVGAIDGDDRGGMAEKRQEIKFQAVVYKVQTLTDNGIRISLDLPEGATMQAAQLMECQRFGVVLEIVAKAQSS